MSKKFLVSVIAIVLACAMAAAVTVAYLTKTSNSISNTFVSGDDLIEGPIDPDDPTGHGLFVTETKNDGSGEVTLTGNSYKVLPGVDLTKDTAVVVNGKTDTPAYLFIEITDDIDGTGLSYTVMSNWLKLADANTEHGAIYVFALALAGGKGYSAAPITSDVNLGIFVDDTIAVSPDIVEGANIDANIDIDAYLCQSDSFDSATEAFEACFFDITD